MKSSLSCTRLRNQACEDLIKAGRTQSSTCSIKLLNVEVKPPSQDILGFHRGSVTHHWTIWTVSLSASHFPGSAGFSPPWVTDHRRTFIKYCSFSPSRSVYRIPGCRTPELKL